MFGWGPSQEGIELAIEWAHLGGDYRGRAHLRLGGRPLYDSLMSRRLVHRGRIRRALPAFRARRLPSS